MNEGVLAHIIKFTSWLQFWPYIYTKMFIRNEFIFPNFAIQTSDAKIKGVLKAFKRGNIVQKVFLRKSNTIPAVFMKNSPLYAIWSKMLIDRSFFTFNIELARTSISYRLIRRLRLCDNHNMNQIVKNGVKQKVLHPYFLQKQ